MLFTTDTNYGIQSHFVKDEHQLQLHLYSFLKKNYFLTRYQNKTADISLWYDIQKKQPLARLRFKTPSKKYCPWQWKSELYIHSKDTLINPLLLPKSVAQSTIWSTQNQKFNFSFLELNLSEKISIPIDSGATVASADASTVVGVVDTADFVSITDDEDAMYIISTGGAAVVKLE